jgi:hypothetical protein
MQLLFVNKVNHHRHYSMSAALKACAKISKIVNDSAVQNNSKSWGKPQSTVPVAVFKGLLPQKLRHASPPAWLLQRENDSAVFHGLAPFINSQAWATQTIRETPKLRLDHWDVKHWEIEFVTKKNGAERKCRALKTSLSGLMPCWRNAAVEYMRY